jgi:hypothetical protein
MHEKLKETWAPPVAPADYPNITAVHFIRTSGGEWHLDFSRSDDSSVAGMFFASDAECCPTIEWPWQEGFEPKFEDWRAIGFVVLEIPSDAGSVQARARAVISEFMRGGPTTLH